MPPWRACAAPTSAWMRRLKRPGGPWLLGERITLADVAVMPSLVRIHDLGLADWQDLPRVATWFDDIRAQPAYKPTFYHGSLLSERFHHLRESARAPACVARLDYLLVRIFGDTTFYV